MSRLRAHAGANLAVSEAIEKRHHPPSARQDLHSLLTDHRLDHLVHYSPV